MIPNRKRSTYTKLTDNDVLEILELLEDGIPQVDIAEAYDICCAHVSSIKHGRSWQHITVEWAHEHGYLKI